MKKNLHIQLGTNFLLGIFILSLFNVPSVSAEGFSDVDESNQNYEAILYLQKQEIIQGYNDGTFQPFKDVNRAEFLKIIIEGSNIPLDIDTITPFPDVDEAGWYGPYVRKAYEEGWINGYNDGTFKPEQTINKVEALKILAKAQSWNIPGEVTEKPYKDVPIDAWFAPYVVYAKEHQYLEEGNILSADTQMTRGSISQIIYNTISPDPEEKPEENNEPENNELEEPEEPEKPLPEPEKESDFTPISYNIIPDTFYSNITLDESLPNIFYKNEVYIISGTINSGSYTATTVILDSEDNSIHQSFKAELKNDRFEIPVHFRKSGNYLLGLIPGESGSSKATTVSVLSNLPESTNIAAAPSAATNLNIKFANDQTFVESQNPDFTIKKLSFLQENETVTYLSRQDTKNIYLKYSDFKNFSEKSTSYFIETANLQSQKPLQISSNFSKTSSKTFNAIEHTYSTIEKENITAAIPDSLDAAEPFSVSGTLKVDGKVEAYITKPNGLVETIDLSTTGTTDTYFSQKIIKSGSNFNLTYNPGTAGRYIVEINNKNSEPILNHPVYIGKIIPLIPDYFDLNERTEFRGTLDLEKEREAFLDLINKDRLKHGLKAIVMANDLNSLAQSHSQDMAQNNFFGHYNLQNKTPNDRRLAAGITTGVGENLAKDVSISFSHYGLMRSGSHRKNILNPEWTRVGLGIAEDDGHLLITQEFSTNELSSGDLSTFKSDLFSEINKQRTLNNKAPLANYSALESASKALNDKVVKEGATITNSSFSSALDQYNVTGSSQLVGRSGTSWTSILDSIVDDEPEILESVWELIGIDIQTDSTGNINSILILNDGN